MTLKEHIEKCQELVQRHPEWANLPAIFDVGDGNVHMTVANDPLGAKATQDGLFFEIYETEEEIEDFSEINCVIIN